MAMFFSRMIQSLHTIINFNNNFFNLTLKRVFIENEYDEKTKKLET